MSNDILDALAKPPPPPSDLDELMSRDPLDMTRTDVDAIIAYQRNARAKREGAPKGRSKRTDLVEHDNAKPIDLAALGLLKPKALPTQSVPSPKPTGGGFRRL